MNVEIKTGTTHIQVFIYDERRGIGKSFRKTNRVGMNEFLIRQLDRLYDRSKISAKGVFHEEY